MKIHNFVIWQKILGKVFLRKVYTKFRLENTSRFEERTSPKLTCHFYLLFSLDMFSSEFGSHLMSLNDAKLFLLTFYSVFYIFIQENFKSDWPFIWQSWNFFVCFDWSCQIHFCLKNQKNRQKYCKKPVLSYKLIFLRR